MKDDVSIKTLYPLPEATDQVLDSVLVACSRYPQESDLFTTCIRTSEVSSAKVAATIRRVLPDLDDKAPLSIGQLVEAIELALGRKRRNIANKG